MGKPKKYSDQDLIDHLRECEEKVDGTMSSGDYERVGERSRSMIQRRFGGTWNDAKKAAGLDYHEWPQLKGRGMEYGRELRRRGECQRCGFDETGALTFHHKVPENKETSPLDDVALERTVEEVKKCLLLCANCHNLHHSPESSVNVVDMDVLDWPSPDEVLEIGGQE